MSEAFTHTDLPRLGKRVLRLGVAGNYGLQTADIHHAAERGVGFWLWTPRFKAVTPALREILARDRESHVVATLNMVLTRGMIRRSVEKSLRALGTDYLDVCLLGWLGRMSFLTNGVQDTLRALQDEGKIRLAGTSIHDRQRAGRLARDSMLDAFMLRYNAKHPGAEQDVFPSLDARKPLVISYTATSWGQLLRPVRGLEMPPWPGSVPPVPPPPLTAGLCYRFCLTSPHVHVALTGPKNRAQLDENLDALEAGPLSADEEAWIRAYGRQVKARKKLPYV
jgi:aryl-alcohol dehydrogenase-like predicted oxidoreductase